MKYIPNCMGCIQTLYTHIYYLTVVTSQLQLKQMSIFKNNSRCVNSVNSSRTIKPLDKSLKYIQLTLVYKEKYPLIKYL